MDLTKLNQSVQSQIRSDMIIYNISRCVTELVENAIDAEATCIAVKLDVPKFQIQVVDNGSGVSKEHLDSIGTRYWSTKCCQNNSKKYSKPHDHRGEFLASIKNSCSRLMIVSRAVGDEITYCKIFDESKTGTVVEALHQRVSKGTTIIINNFFGNFPVRQKRIVPAVEIRNTKRCIQGISLMYPSILFILKDDSKNVEILRIPRASSTLRTFRFLFPQVIDHNSSMIKVVADDRNISMRAMICREAHNNRDLQFVFVNKRFMIRSEIRIMLDELLSKKGFFEGVSQNTENVSQPRLRQQRQKSTLSKKQPKYAIFILNICCRPDEYRVTFLPDKRQVDFKDRMKIKQCLTELVDSFWKRGLFGDSSVPQNAAVAPPEKTKSTFMPRLLFEKMNKIRMIRGAPASRKVATARVDSNEDETSRSDMVEICRPNPIDEAPSRAASRAVSKELRETAVSNSLSLEMPHRKTASSPSILEPFKQLDSRPILREKFGQNENENPVDSEVQSTHRPAPVSSSCTPSCIPPTEKLILSTVSLLNRRNLRQEGVNAAEKSISSILNTSKIHEKLRSVKAHEIEVLESNPTSSGNPKATYNEKYTSSGCIQTSSNIPLYDVKRKFHLRKTKTSGRACKLEGLRKIKLKEKRHQSEVNHSKRKNLDYAPKKMAVLKKSILQVDNTLYEPKIQPSQSTSDPKLTSQANSQKTLFSLWNQRKECSHEFSGDARQNPVERTQISKSSLTFDDKNEALVANQEQISTKSQSLVSNQNPEKVSRTNRSNIKKQIPAVADFIYAPNLQTSKDFGSSKNTTFHSESNTVFRGTSLVSPEIFTTKREFSQNLWFTSKMVPYDENCFSRELFVGENLSSGARSNFYPALKQQEKSAINKSCKVPQCVCSCHKRAKSSTNSSICSATLVLASSQKESANMSNSAPATRISPSLFSSRITESQTAAEFIPNYSSSTIPVSTNGNVCGSNAAKSHSFGTFSELADFNSVARKAGASQRLGTSISSPPTECLGVQNTAEILPVFSKSYSENLPNKVAHDSCSLLTQSMDKCSVKSNAAEVASDHPSMFRSKREKDFKLTFASRRISSEYDEKISNIWTLRNRGPNDPTQLADNSFDTDEDNFSFDDTPGSCDSTQLADDSFSIDLKDSSNNSPQAYTLSQLANDSFCGNFENSWVGNTPGGKFFTRLSRDSFCQKPKKSELGKPKAVSAHDSTQMADNSFSMDLENSTLSRSDSAESTGLIQLTSDSFSNNLESSNGNIGAADQDTQLANDSFCVDLENSKLSMAFGTNDPTQLANDSFSMDLENSKIDNTVEANDPSQLANDSIRIDLTSCSTVDPIPCGSTEESNQSETNETICHENDLLIEKILYKRNSKFLGAASIFDVPKGILDVQGTKSRSIPFEKSQKIDFNKFTKPCSMKDHLTFDDYGNSCLRIFPLMKGIIDSKEDDFKFSYGNFPEDLNCSIVFSKVDLKSVQFLAQLENKFLLGSLIMKDSQDQILVMFDQHAVDERIRVERLNEDYVNEKGTWRSVPVNDSICMRVSRCEISVILDFREDFCSRGIDFDFTDVEENSDDQFSIKVIRVPLCLHNRASREPTKTNIVTCLKQLTESLIKELTYTLIRTRGISRSATPQILQNIINSEACRGAVKFGEQLSSDICSTLLQSLWSCNMPFQCAHGRPLLTPLANVAKLAHIGKQKLPKRTFDELKIQLL